VDGAHRGSTDRRDREETSGRGQNGRPLFQSLTIDLVSCFVGVLVSSEVEAAHLPSTFSSCVWPRCRFELSFFVIVFVSSGMIS